MTYTQIAVMVVVLVVAIDLWVLRTQVIRRALFWVSYAIILPFQWITNGVFTGAGIVLYDGAVILGSTSPSDGRPPFIGDGRMAYAPVEDMLFGFALILLALSFWVYFGRRGVQRTPTSGPPRMWLRSGPLGQHRD